MSKKDFIREVIRAIDKVNEKIDRRIIDKMPYGNLAKEHARLRQLITLYR